jgi:Ca-activated chloride channel family protein
LRINTVEDVDLVNLYVVVKDQAGRYITDLAREDFTILEDGRRQRIDRFTTERRPLAIGIVLDTSLTMEGGKLEAARDSALRFLDALEPEDSGMIVSFSDRVRILHELTPQRDLLAQAIRSVEAKGGTALYDAIWKTVDRLDKLDGRRVLVLLSDGRDEAANGLEPGSLHTLNEALDKALHAEVMIFAIGFGKHLDRQLDFYERETLADILTRFGETTGGRVLFPRRAGSLRKAFEEVALDLRHQYSIAYKSTNRDKDGAWREIRLDTTRPNLEVVTRHGYFAPAEVETASNDKPQRNR